MVPCVSCPWGCSEPIFHSGCVSLDLIYQRFLLKVNLDVIKDISVMKYVTYIGDDYIFVFMGITILAY